jgi:hypothetical protein
MGPFTLFQRIQSKKVDSICFANKCDSVKVNIELTKLLAQNKLFNDFFIPFYKRYKDNKTQSLDKPELSLDSLVALTSRFYFAEKYPDGKVRIKVCIAANPYSDFNTITPIQMEIGGFCFLVVRYSEVLWDCFMKHAGQIEKEMIDLKISDDNFVQYKSKRISELMKKDSTLRSEVLSTFEKNQTLLGFKIKH